MAETVKGKALDLYTEGMYWLTSAKPTVPPSLEKAEVGFFDSFVARRVKFEQAEKGRVICSFKVTPSLCNVFKVLHGGVVASLVDVIGTAAIITTGTLKTGVSLDITVSFVSGAKLGDEIEVDAKCLRVGTTLAQVTVDLKNRTTGQIVAQGRHTKFLRISSKL